jgi:hypothetical protein
VCARAIAGAFGGPATSISLSIIADVVPPARRGRAMGAVMGAFSVASVFGVYSALELARYGGWRLPFIVVAALGVVVVVLALWAMPPMRSHIVVGASRSSGPQLSALLGDGTIRLALAMNGLVMLTAFLVVPNIAPHLLQNLGFPFTGLRWGYMIGGASSFLIHARRRGTPIDRYGAAARRHRRDGGHDRRALFRVHRAGPDRRRRRDAGVRPVHGGHVGAQRQHELAVHARCRAPTSARATCRCSRPRSTSRLRPARSRHRGCCTRPRVAGSRASRRSR